MAHKHKHKKVQAMTKVTEKKMTSGERLKELLVFQVKLLADAGRDLLLSPIAIICTIMDAVSNSSKEKSYFEKLMSFGRKTDHHINLFKHTPVNQGKVETVDDAAQYLEETLLKELKAGGLTEKGYTAVKEVLKKAAKKASPNPGNK